MGKPSCVNTSSCEDRQNIGIIKEITRKGIMSTVEISKILEHEHGVKIAPHLISEYFFHARRGC